METSGDQIKEETVIVVLGASGDLAKKKTFPALFALYSQGYLPKDVHIVGYARTSESSSLHTNVTRSDQCDCG
jgi:glucose-6-phosphate 1-dehydrogenase